MTTITGKELFEAFAGTDNQPYSYSGRAMYGKHCCAITFNTYFDGCAALVETLTEAGHSHDQIADLIRSARGDSMGHNVVIYWPNLAWDNSFEDTIPDEDEEDVE